MLGRAQVLEPDADTLTSEPPSPPPQQAQQHLLPGVTVGVQSDPREAPGPCLALSELSKEQFRLGVQAAGRS